MCEALTQGMNDKDSISHGYEFFYIADIKSLTLYVDKIKHINMKTQYTQVLPPEWQPMSQVFTALGEEHRQRILLLFDKDEELNVSQIAAVSILSRPTVSHHLKILRQANILLAEKRGKEVWYRINTAYLAEVLGNVLAYVQALS